MVNLVISVIGTLNYILQGVRGSWKVGLTQRDYNFLI